jgi:hypothetical protein
VRWIWCRRFRMKIEFNQDGSIKVPEHFMKKQIDKNNKVIIERIQINRNNPAIAHLRIETPENTYYDELINEAYSKCELLIPSVSHELQKTGKNSFIIKIDKGSKLMYSWMELMIDNLKKVIGEENIIVEGVWDKYGNDFTL